MTIETSISGARGNLSTAKQQLLKKRLQGQARGAGRAGGAGVRAGALDEVVHLTVVERLLLVAVVVVLVTRELTAGVATQASRATV